VKVPFDTLIASWGARLLPLVQTVLPYAHQVWAGVGNPHGQILKVEHDHYLKVWQLTEAQDTTARWRRRP
jgi:hypothetical protein